MHTELGEYKKRLVGEKKEGGEVGLDESCIER